MHIGFVSPSLMTCIAVLCSVCCGFLLSAFNINQDVDDSVEIVLL